jgi:hypothetical protein
VVLNSDGQDHQGAALTALKKRLTAESIFSPFLLQANWVQSLSSEEGFQSSQIDANALNGGLDAKLHTNLAIIRQNTERNLPPLVKGESKASEQQHWVRSNGFQLPEHLAKFQEAWNAGFQRICAVQSTEVATTVAKRFTGLLGALQDVLLPHLDADREILAVPAFHAATEDK